MAKIVVSTFGSLGDLHPMIALGLELKKRGHAVVFATMEYYREKLEMLGLVFVPMAPHLSPNEIARVPELMDAATGTEKLLREIIIPSVPEMYEDLMKAADGADLLITGEIVYAARSVVDKTKIKWVSTTLAPISLFSVYDPPVPPQYPLVEYLRGLGAAFRSGLNYLAGLMVNDWLTPYREFRRGIGLDENHDPLFGGKYSGLLHLIMFSKALGKPQPDWPPASIQTGFCFYDGLADTGTMPVELEEFLDKGERPIVFTLGSAAVMDPRNFFEESIKAATELGQRAVVLYGTYNDPPAGSTARAVGFDYAPYSLLFPRALCVVHQAGVGTTGQVMRAGVPQLIVPYGHDQPDNAARCRRAGVAEIIQRDSYNSRSAAAGLDKVLSDPKYRNNAVKLKDVVDSEHGTHKACNAIEAALN